jgi:U4/U6.U5 tri-snRNP-associated protein 1
MEEKREVKLEPVEPQAPPAEDDGLTFDDTTEFIRNVQLQPVIVKVQTQPKKEDGTASVQSPRVKDEPMDEDEAMSEMEAGEVDEDEEMNEEDMLAAIEGVIKEAEAAVKEEQVNREVTMILLYRREDQHADA